VKPSGHSAGTPQDLELGYLLARLGSQAHGAWAKVLETYDMAPSQFIMLKIIAGFGAAHQQEISDAMGIDARNAGGIVDKLVAMKLVDRVRDSDDRRKQILRATSKGKSLISKINVDENRSESDFAAGLTEDQREQLRSLLQKLFSARRGQAGS
jgi:DNA-binding MarR family transcriptional regulator